jgi:hypothetical protein
MILYRRIFQVNSALINISAAGANTVVPGLSGFTIVGVCYHLVCSGAVDLKWKSGSTDISGIMSFLANGGITAPGDIRTGGIFETAPGEDLVLYSSASVVVGGVLRYAYVPV